MKTMHLLSKVGGFFKRPQNWMLVIISFPIIYILWPVISISLCFFLLILCSLWMEFITPITDIIFPPKPRETFLQNHEYKIVKFIRSGGDLWAHGDYIWYLKFPKGFNSVDAIPMTSISSDVECLEYNAYKNNGLEIENQEASFFMGKFSDSFPPYGKVYIIYPDRTNNTTRTLFYFPGKEPEDLFLEYQPRW